MKKQKQATKITDSVSKYMTLMYGAAAIQTVGVMLGATPVATVLLSGCILACATASVGILTKRSNLLQSRQDYLNQKKELDR